MMDVVTNVSLGAVALAALALVGLITRKHFEHAKLMRESLDKNSGILNELRITLERLNGKLE